MDELGEAELLDAGRTGRVLECGDGDTPRPVDAGLLRRCCLELTDQIDPRGVRLQNALITGRLDLAGLDVPFPLRFEGCEFDSAPIVEGARLYELALTGCQRLPGLLANGLRTRRDVDLSRSHVTGGHHTSASTSRRSAIWLCESDIGGRLLCVDTVIHADDGRSLQADLMHVGGTVRMLHRFTAVGEIRLLGVRIDGSLDLTGARIESSAGLALDLAGAIIGGSVFVIKDTAGRRPVIRGRVDMGSARISGQLLIRDATLKEPVTIPVGGGYSRPWVSGTALSAPRLSVGAEVTLEGSCEVTGGLDLSMSDMSGLSIRRGCAVRAAARTALDLTNAELRSNLTLENTVTVEGTIDLTGAQIHGYLSLRGAALSAPDSVPGAPEMRSLIAASGLKVDGDMDLRDLRAMNGALRFRNATLGGIINAVGAHLTNPGGYTLNLHQALVKGSVRLVEGFESRGLVVLNRATIDGRLECTGGSFIGSRLSTDNQRDHAIEAISATIRGGMDLGWTSISPSVDFTNTTTTFLADDPQNWPPRFIVSGFTYDRFFEQPRETGSGKTWDRAARCTWLSRQAVYDSGPYEQAARVFRQHGYTSEAEEILIAQRRQARRVGTGRAGFLRHALDVVYGASVGYGYRPGRVLWLLATLLVLVTASLEIQACQAALRAATPAGNVYTTHGPLPVAAAVITPVATTVLETVKGSIFQPTAAKPHRALLIVSRVDACGDGQVRCFNPVLYAFDTVIPLISLDQRSTWYPDPHAPYGSLMEWWLNIATLLGWLLSSIFVLSLARLARTT